MSKRHNSSRRRSYGRRQHELHERIDRVTERRRAERAWRLEHQAGMGAVTFDNTAEAPFGFLD